MIRAAATPRGDGGHVGLVLYIAGAAPASTRALANVVRICREHLQDAYDLEVVDLYQQPDRAAGADVIAAPTLVRVRPAPTRAIVGDLSDERRVLLALDRAPA